MFVQPLNENEYSILPVYVANQFSLESINHHLDTINQFLLSNNEGKECLSTAVKDRQACYVGKCYHHCREKSRPVVREKFSNWASNFSSLLFSWSYRGPHPLTNSLTKMARSCTRQAKCESCLPTGQARIQVFFSSPDTG